MTKRMFGVLKFILVISLIGLLFSGYLTYRELFTTGCNLSFVTCGKSGNIAGVPACVYGFAMYLMILMAAVVGFCETKAKGKTIRK